MKLLSKFKKPKPFKFYFVIKTKDYNKSDMKYLTITATFNQADEWIIRQVEKEHHQHFVEWCRLHHKNSKDLSVFVNQYAPEILTDEEATKYSIGCQKINAFSLCNVLRMSIGYNDIGCSYEKDNE